MPLCPEELQKVQKKQRHDILLEEVANNINSREKTIFLKIKDLEII